jgi:hypothetical protein
MRVVREPAAIIGIIGSILTSAAAVDVGWFTPGQSAAIVAFASGLLIALRSRPIAPGLFVGSFGALVALLAEYQVHLSAGWVGLLTSIILGSFAFFGIRPQVEPTTFSGTVIPGEVASTATVAR